MPYMPKRASLNRPDGSSLELPPHVVEGLDAVRQRFRDKFGRDPGPGDPVFFDEGADTPQPITREAMLRTRDATLEAMRSVKIRPQMIYAYEKTGFVVSQDGYKNMMDKDRNEFDAAVAEYLALEKAGKVTAQQIWDGTFKVEPNPGAWG